MIGSTAPSALPASVVSLPSSGQLPSGQSGVSGNAAALNENDFFKLMTTQLENQDPLNPMSGAEFAAELAQFSTANGVQQLQSTVTGLGSQIGTVGGIQAASLVGRNVAVNGSILTLGQNGGGGGVFNLGSAAADVVVTISDTAGNAVAKMDLGPMAAGSGSFSWNGQTSDGTTAPLGTYQFQVNAVGAQGNAVSATPYAVVPVTGVSFGGQNGPLLDLGGGLAPVPMTAIQQIF